MTPACVWQTKVKAERSDSVRCLVQQYKLEYNYINEGGIHTCFYSSCSDLIGIV
jgi:hypothetical protein